MEPHKQFHYCPRCGASRSGQAPAIPFHCDDCGFHFYFNPTVAGVALILREDGNVLLIRRAQEPAKGRLAMVGGFVDIDETVEDAVRREVKEEVNLDLSSIEFLCSEINEYHYRNVTYPVLDLFFVATASNVKDTAPMDGVDRCEWLDPMSIDPKSLAFPSMEKALLKFQQRRGR